MPPFRIRLPKTQKGGSHALTGNKISGVDSADGVNMEDTLIVEAYTPPDPGPYPQDQPKQNSVRFTPTQVLCNYFFNCTVLFFMLICVKSFLMIQSPLPIYCNPYIIGTYPIGCVNLSLNWPQSK